MPTWLKLFSDTPQHQDKLVSCWQKYRSKTQLRSLQARFVNENHQTDSFHKMKIYTSSLSLMNKIQWCPAFAASPNNDVVNFDGIVCLCDIIVKSSNGATFMYPMYLTIH